MTEEAKNSLEKIGELLDQIVNARATLVEYFGPEVIIAAETLKNFEKLENDLKQLRGEVLEYLV